MTDSKLGSKNEAGAVIFPHIQCILSHTLNTLQYSSSQIGNSLWTGFPVSYLIDNIFTCLTVLILVF